MRTYLNVLNDSAVTFIPDLSKYGWDYPMTGPGWEVYSPSGEVRCFLTQAEAEAWRNSEVAEAFRIENS